MAIMLNWLNIREIFFYTKRKFMIFNSAHESNDRYNFKKS